MWITIGNDRDGAFLKMPRPLSRLCIKKQVSICAILSKKKIIVENC